MSSHNIILYKEADSVLVSTFKMLLLIVVILWLNPEKLQKKSSHLQYVKTHPNITRKRLTLLYYGEMP